MVKKKKNPYVQEVQNGKVPLSHTLILHTFRGEI